MCSVSKPFLNASCIQNLHVLAGYKNLKDHWLSNYETNNIMDEIDAVWYKVEPLYKKLHAYVRKMLRILYPNDELPKEDRKSVV